MHRVFFFPIQLSGLVPQDKFPEVCNPWGIKFLLLLISISNCITKTFILPSKNKFLQHDSVYVSKSKMVLLNIVNLGNTIKFQKVFAFVEIHSEYVNDKMICLTSEICFQIIWKGEWSRVTEDVKSTLF